MNKVGDDRRAAARLRGADRVLPRGDLPRRDALRHEPRARLGAHHASALVVAVGTTLSAFWILALNSWMQTPDRPRRWSTASWIAGDWWAVIFNPSFPTASRTCCSPRGSPRRSSSRGFRRGGCSRAPADAARAQTLRAGLRHRRGAGAGADLRRRPARPEHARAPAGEDRGDGSDLAHRARRAARAVRDPQRGDAAQRLSRSSCPYGASLILKHDAARRGEGLDAFAPDHPPVAPVFFALPHHGRHGRADARACRGIGAWRTAQRPARRRAGCCGCFAGVHLLRLDRDARRLDRDRGRAASRGS